MSELLKRKIEEQHKLFNRMQEIQRVAEDENRDWTAEERANWDKANADIDVVSADVERLDKQAKRDVVQTGTVIRSGSPLETPEQSAEERDAEREAKYEKAFGSFIRSGYGALNSEQRDLLQERATTDPQATTGNSVGGYLIPPGYRLTMTETKKAFGGIYNYANVITTSTGNPLQWPTNNDTGNVGRILTENTAVTTNQVTWGTKTIGAFMYSSDQVLVSLQLLQDSAFNLDQWLPRKLGERLGRIQATHFVTGTGSGQPEGILQNGVTGVTAASGSLTYDNFVDLEHSVDPAYRASPNCRFFFADSTLAVARKIKDTQGRPLWLPVPVPGTPATINGVAYTIDQAMPAVGTGNKSVAFGDLHAGYIIREVLDVQLARLAERYAEFLQVGYFAFNRLDAKQDDSAAYKILVHA